MTRQKAESLFHQLAESSDEKLQLLVREWHPWYGRGNDEYGLIPKFKEYGIDPCLKTTLKHSQIVSLGVEAAANADIQAAARAFLCAVSIGDLQKVRWLIPLRAISNTRHLPKHAFKDNDGRCAVCGESTDATWNPMWAMFCLNFGGCGEDWEVLNNVMMVRWFNQSDPPEPKRADVTLFNQVLKFIAAADSELTAHKLARLTKKQFKGHEDAWRSFFETLAFAGVLKTDKHPGHLQQWTDQSMRARPMGRGDARSPMCYWKRKLGFDVAVFDELFPNCSLPKSLRAS